MTLPYNLPQSTTLRYESTGWHTYEIDVTAFLQETLTMCKLDMNAIYGGGNAHPRYTGTTRYYMITDRYNVRIIRSGSSPHGT
jgi:hypothetical protein